MHEPPRPVGASAPVPPPGGSTAFSDAHGPAIRPLRWKGTIAAAAVLGALAFLLLYFPEQGDGSGATLGAIGVLLASALGLAAVARTRRLPTRDVRDHARLAGLSIGIGAIVGLANLASNYALAGLDPAVREWMLERWAGYSSWSIVLADPLMEEIAFRLFFLGSLAWLVSQWDRYRHAAFPIALGASALVFGLLHIVDPVPFAGAPALLHPIGVVVKSTAAGMVFGWVFWRWGLPYAFAAHAVANAVHLLVAPMVF